MLQQIQQADLDFEDLERIAQQDLSIVYKLLRYVNSASFGLRREIESVQEALRILGENEVRKLISLILLTTMATDRPEQLLLDSMTRARFAELLARDLEMSSRRQELFLLGLFSMLDAIIGKEMADVLQGLPVPADIRDALLSDSGGLAPVLQFVIAYERADWEKAHTLIEELGLSADTLTETHLQAVEWAREGLADTDHGSASSKAA